MSPVIRFSDREEKYRYSIQVGIAWNTDLMRIFFTTWDKVFFFQLFNFFHTRSWRQLKSILCGSPSHEGQSQILLLSLPSAIGGIDIYHTLEYLVLLCQNRRLTYCNSQSSKYISQIEKISLSLAAWERPALTNNRESSTKKR